jgi:hypothetical protein
MKRLTGLLGVFAAAAVLILSAGTAKADNYVYGNSSGFLSGPLVSPPIGTDYLALTTAGGVEYAPLGFYSITLPNQLVPTINGDSGWFTATAEEGPGGDNYVTGNDSSVASGHLRSFLSFNVTGLSSPVLSAALVLDTYSVLTAGTETVDFLGGIDSVNGGAPATSTTAADYVLATEQNESPAAADIANIYTALGTGPLYGSFGYTNADTGTSQAIGLDASFLADINSSLTNGNSLYTIGEDDVTPAAVPLPSPLLGGAVLMAGLGLTRFVSRRRQSIAA